MKKTEAQLGVGTLHQLVRFQRRSAPLVVVVMLVGVFCIPFSYKIGCAIVSACDFWMLGVPCGIPAINCNQFAWVIRQTFFAGMGVANAMPLFG